MKTLLVAVNASFSHTCLAVRSICQFVKSHKDVNCECDFVEFTINQPAGEILRGIAKENPDIVLFSSYIWNAEVLRKILPDVKKILPCAVIGVGGPEFGFAAEYYLKLLPSVDFIMKGEGEVTVLTLIQNFGKGFEEVKGIYYRKQGGQTPEGDEHRGQTPICFTGEQNLICDLSELPFAYPEFEPNKIFYYESSRGCPYNCSYCMSSVEHSVRFMPLERVFADLQRFLDGNVPLVKFVDRTYNINPQRYIGIWEYILQHHNGKTMFHFEIEAEYLSEEALIFLQQVPSGVMQFEIGVQSANKQTLKAVNRSPNVEKLAQNIKRIPDTIHQHLDLIAGLPFEDMESFGKSFDFVMALKPDALQLGFLKVLHGTQMEQYAKANGWQWMENPVYETLSTPYMSYADLLFLKDIEVLVDAYYNSGVFKTSMQYIGRTIGFWKFFSETAKNARKDGVFSTARRETFWFEYLSSTKDKVLYELLKYDFVLRGKQGNFPDWYKRDYDRNGHLKLMEKAEVELQKKIGFARSEYERYKVDVDSDFPELTYSENGIYEKIIIYDIKK